MRYDQFYQCPNCGCALDPGEKCDCQKEKKEADANDAKRFIYGDPGQHKLEKVTYHAQSYNNYITDDRTTLPAIIRIENGEGDQLTLDAFYEKEAAGHGTEPGL